MIKYKTLDEIKIMQEGGEKLKEIVQVLASHLKPGIKTIDIDRLAETEIKKRAGKPSFKSVKGYYWSTCLSINEQVVHTPPSDRILKEGEILTIDIGIKYRGYHTDYATTLIIGKENNEEVKKFLEVGRETLNKAIKKAKINHYLGELSKEIQENINKNGYHILKELTGHGIGRDLHEDPFVLGFLDREIHRTLKMQAGLVLAIEIIYSKGTEEIRYEDKNAWSIKTKDDSLSACFEKTVAILSNKTIVLT